MCVQSKETQRLPKGPKLLYMPLKNISRQNTPQFKWLYMLVVINRLSINKNEVKRTKSIAALMLSHRAATTGWRCHRIIVDCRKRWHWPQGVRWVCLLLVSRLADYWLARHWWWLYFCYTFVIYSFHLVWISVATLSTLCGVFFWIAGFGWCRSCAENWLFREKLQI